METLGTQGGLGAYGIIRNEKPLGLGQHSLDR